jgi:hypothetical protein
VLHGGCVAAVLYSAAEKHFTTTLASHRQPDVFTLHLEFLRPCIPENSTIKITDLKVGKGTNFIQLEFMQNGVTKVIALATSTNFSFEFGPSAKTTVSFPGLKPKPDFKKVEAHEPDENWIPAKMTGELLNIGKHSTLLYPAEGQTTDGTIDYWCVADKPIKFSGAQLALLGDLCPSASDTLLRTGGIYDAHRLHRGTKEATDKEPGKPAMLTNTLKEAMTAVFWNSTVTMDLHFKQRLPEEEMFWTFTRVTTRMLVGGRMDLDVTICDRDMVPLCLVRQVLLVLDSRRRFKEGAKGQRPKI